MALLTPAQPSARVVSAAAGLDTIQTLGQLTLTTGVTIQSDAALHTLGTITEILSAASNTIEAEWIKVSVHGSSNTASNTNQLLNIYLGGAGSEVLFIDSLQVGWAANDVDTGLPRTYWFPVRIPRGTRISGALRAAIASDTVEVIIELGVSNGQHWVGSGVETLGEDTANSRGTSITPATFGASWATIGTTGRRYRYIIQGVQGNNDTTLLDGLVAYTVGTGSAMLQKLSMLMTRTDGVEVHSNVGVGWWCDIPSATSLQLRAIATAAPSGLVYATLHGVY